MVLYEIDRALEALIDPETGELLDYEAFAALQMEREAKLENTALWVKDLAAECAALRAEEVKLAERRRVKENRAKRLRDYLTAALDGEKLETARCTVSYRRAAALEVTDLSAAAKYLEESGRRDLVTYGAPALDKRGVMAALKTGEAVPGVEIVDRVSTIIK